jgi:hypothetical protein
LQAFSAVLQSLVPLQEFTPVQCTFAFVVAAVWLGVPAQPARTSAAAPAAMSTPLLDMDMVSFDIVIPFQKMIK